MTATADHHQPPTARRRINWRVVVGVFLIVAACTQSFLTYQQAAEDQRRAECQAQINGAFLAALANRDEANKELTDAQRALVDHPVDPTDVRAREAAARRYREALDRQQASRDANPLPRPHPC